ncbi:hypothetical protein [Alteromonas halophila]|uniref:Uncharacterized protein n=1 Tax=Alteromonas halophila TaxID=516698 RepID=A0A918JTT1_9ALTE|nr:hypothetical protein [Alteromonas halophila]GGW97907.1 hypothetical protein GCM10007391_34900 [Alteromonas halophila]
MSKELYLFLGALVTALIGLLVARFTSGVQLKIAEGNSDKDVQLQEARLADERLKSEVALERNKLETLHKILSVISFENSQTMSYIQSSEINLFDFRKRYIENCDRLHDALAITDLYYPGMSKSIRDIFAEANSFWGYQEGVIQTDITENEQGWQSNMSKVLNAGHAINKHVRSFQFQIAEHGKDLKRTLNLTSR